MNRTVDLPMSWADSPARRFEWLMPTLSGAAVAASAVATWLIWLFLTQPVQVARVIDQGGARDVARLLVTAMYEIVLKVLTWL